jgi:hypothetical protein
MNNLPSEVQMLLINMIDGPHNMSLVAKHYNQEVLSKSNLKKQRKPNGKLASF